MSHDAAVAAGRRAKTLEEQIAPKGRIATAWPLRRRTARETPYTPVGAR